MTHVFDSWIFGQHVYWSVGRGLVDARSQGKTILRLKVVLEEGGWMADRSVRYRCPRCERETISPMPTQM